MEVGPDDLIVPESASSPSQRLPPPGLSSSTLSLIALARISESERVHQPLLAGHRLWCRVITTVRPHFFFPNNADPRLSTLDISRIPFESIPPPTAEERISLAHLVLYETTLSSWTDIDTLEVWTSGSLKSLRIALAGVQDDGVDDQASTTTATDMKKIAGKAMADRYMLIAKLSSLDSLNSSPITPNERRDAETWYVDRLGKLPEEERREHGRYEELCKKYGTTPSQPPSAVPRSGALKSKLISESQFWSSKTSRRTKG